MNQEKSLTPAAELAAKVSKPFPNESADYRKAREALLVEEIKLRRQLWRVAEKRRELPLGGEPPAYTFTDEEGNTLTLADMFGPHDTLVTYFWMYGPRIPVRIRTVRPKSCLCGPS